MVCAGFRGGLLWFGVVCGGLGWIVVVCGISMERNGNPINYSKRNLDCKLSPYGDNLQVRHSKVKLVCFSFFVFFLYSIKGEVSLFFVFRFSFFAFRFSVQVRYSFFDIRIRAEYRIFTFEILF